MKLSAAILAGGHSRRMGRDKSLLPDVHHGTLLARQAALLRGLDPLELLISCRHDQDLPVPRHAHVVHDAGTHGPLAGLAALLTAMRGDMLLVLAVDLGAMTAPILRDLIRASSGVTGVVPRTARGAEPLAALYPAVLAGPAVTRLESGRDLSLQAFAHAGVEAGLLRWYDIPPSDEAAFANWNTPADVEPPVPEP